MLVFHFYISHSCCFYTFIYSWIGWHLPFKYVVCWCDFACVRVCVCAFVCLYFRHLFAELKYIYNVICKCEPYLMRLSAISNVHIFTRCRSTCLSHCHTLDLTPPNTLFFLALYYCLAGLYITAVATTKTSALHNNFLFVLVVGFWFVFPLLYFLFLPFHSDSIQIP